MSATGSAAFDSTGVAAFSTGFAGLTAFSTAGFASFSTAFAAGFAGAAAAGFAWRSAIGGYPRSDPPHAGAAQSRCLQTSRLLRRCRSTLPKPAANRPKPAPLGRSLIIRSLVCSFCSHHRQLVDSAKSSTALFVATIARWWMGAMVVVCKDPPLGSGGYSEEMTAGKEISP